LSFLQDNLKLIVQDTLTLLIRDIPDLDTTKVIAIYIFRWNSDCGKTARWDLFITVVCTSSQWGFKTLCLRIRVSDIHNQTLLRNKYRHTPTRNQW
jgi:hypothetical protein